MSRCVFYMSNFARLAKEKKNNFIVGVECGLWMCVSPRCAGIDAHIYITVHSQHHPNLNTNIFHVHLDCFFLLIVMIPHVLHTFSSNTLRLYVHGVTCNGNIRMHVCIV